MAIDSSERSDSFLQRHRGDLRLSLVTQVIAVLIAATILDEGEFALLTVLAMVGYWLLVGWSALRGKAECSRDRYFVRWGFLAFWIVAFVIGAVSRRFRA